MRLLVSLAILVAGCTNARSAYLNATEAYDGDLRRMVLQLEHRQEEPKLDWALIERLTNSDIDRLRAANKTFSQGPPGSEAMRKQALDLIVKLVPPIEFTHSLAPKTSAPALTPAEKATLAPQIKEARAALTVYDVERKKFIGE